MTENLAARLKLLRQNATLSVHHSDKATPAVLNSYGQHWELKVLLLWVWTHAALHGTIWKNMRGKAPAAPLKAINLQTTKTNNSSCAEGLLYLPWIFSSPPLSSWQLIKPLVSSSLYAKMMNPSFIMMNPSFIMMCYILNFSWFPTSHSKGQLFSMAQTEPACRSLSSQKTANICTHISNNLRRTI